MKKFLSAAIVFLLLVVPVHIAKAGTTSTWWSNSTSPDCIRINLNNGYSLLKLSSGYTGNLCRADNGCDLVFKVYRLPGAKVTPTPAPTPNPVPDPTPTPEPVPTPTPSSETFSAMQTEMLGYINAERAKVNAAPLVLDQALCNGASLKSKDMAVNKYFDHNSPTYGTPFEMMKTLGITYQMAGENIAKNTSVKGAHDAFMNSPGHKANILNTGYQKVGLGFYQDGAYLYVTQWFTN